MRPASVRCNAEIATFSLGKSPAVCLTKSMPIRAVLFDLDDTLIVDAAVTKEAIAATASIAFAQIGAIEADFQRSVLAHAPRLAAAAALRPFCKRIGISPFECLWGEFSADTPDFRALREWARTYRCQVFDAALRDQQIDGSDVAEQLAASYEKTRRRLARLMPDAMEVLVRLSPNYRLGLLTNGAPDLQREKIAASGLGAFFDAIAISGEHDIGKPEAEIFHRLLAELDVPAQQAVMIGNSLERDIAGATNAGIASIWIKVPGAEETADVTPTATILTLAELPNLVAQLGGSGVLPVS
jgi:putative hydrolase of the HAD superfamily